MDSTRFAPDFSLTRPTSVVVLGAARSGLAAALFLHKKGYQVFLSDAGRIDDGTCAQLRAQGIAFEQGGHAEAFGKQPAFVVASPGIPLTAKPYQWAHQNQVPVVSEVELAWQFLQTMDAPPPVVAVTGSNGKSTVVSLMAALLRTAGYRVSACGNIGLPLIQCVAEHEIQPFDYLVLEISSFQLETTDTLQPAFGLLLNLYENHLDRHGDLETYFALKSRLFQCQNARDIAILSQENPWCQRLAQHLNALPEGPRVLDFSVAQVTEGQHLMYQGEALLPLSEIRLQGHHNLENIAAVLTLAEQLKLSGEVIAETLRYFQGMPHRLEPVGEWQGCLFINDSKSTNYLAAETALKSMTRPVVWIAGGQDKGGDFSPLARCVKEKVKHVVLMGESQANFSRSLSQTGYNQMTRVNGMKAALAEALRHAESGDVILLSPATASYDAYANFEARGDDFRAHVAQLISEP